jgi:ArsR family metal-binding transcriptional regulator
MTKCSRNLRKHLTLLKQECNQIVTLHNNGYKVTLQTLKDYNEHKRYVTELLKREKMESYDKILMKSR